MLSIIDLLTNELGELDTSDEKLQKMLESGLNSDSNYSPDGAGGGAGGGVTAGITGNTDTSLSALLNPQVGKLSTQNIFVNEHFTFLVT